MNPFFSVIIPVYNVEQYLNQCVCSVLNQAFSDYEIILVDDGSTDNSGKMCNTCADKYCSVSVIHKANGGLSDARNAGIREAKGTYILFIDSDDYIAEGSLERIANRIHNSNQMPDVIFLDAVKVYPDGEMVPMCDGYDLNAIDGKSHIEVLQHIAALPKYPGSACTKAIKRSVIVDNNLFFQEGLLSEDIDWTVGLLKNAEVFSYEAFPYYFYRQGRSGSIANSGSLKKTRDLLSIIQKWGSQDITGAFCREINAFMAYEYCVLLINYGGLSREDRMMIAEEIRKEKWVLKYGRSRKVRAVKLATDTLGIELTSQLLHRVLKR